MSVRKLREYVGPDGEAVYVYSVVLDCDYRDGSWYQK